MDQITQTKVSYNLLWEKTNLPEALKKWHFHDMQAKIPEPIVRGSYGLEVGSGAGFDTYIMASANPQVTVASLDLSEGIFKTGRICANLPNVMPIQGSVLDLPLRNNTFDFVYSYGVLHHTPFPQQGTKEIARVLKQKAPVFLYLYEDHSENFFKGIAVRVLRTLRAITTRMNPRLLHWCCFVMSPLVVILFAFPARVLSKFSITKDLASKMPFNFGTHLFSVTGDLYDRFSVPLEFRFSRKEAVALLKNSGFSDIRIDRINDRAGWIVWGYKK